MYCSSEIAEKIRKLSKERNITLSEMFEKIHLGKNTMANLKTSMPKADNLARIADFLNCSVDYLLGRSEVPEVNTKTVDKPLIIPEELSKSSTRTIIIPFYRTPASAGEGSWLSDETPTEWVTVSKNDKATAADFMLEVRGNSMQPKYFDGDRVLVKQSLSVYEGEVGVFILNGESYIKKMGKGELISLNPEYDPIKLKEFDDYRCVGKVLGIAPIAK